MGTKEIQVGKMETRLQNWGTRLDEFVAKAGEAGADVKEDYIKHVDELKTKHKEMQGKLAELKASGADEWESFKAGFNSTWDELDAAIEKLTS